MKDQGRKQIDAVEVLKPDTPQLTIKDTIPEDQLNEEVKKWNR